MGSQICTFVVPQDGSWSENWPAQGFALEHHALWCTESCLVNFAWLSNQVYFHMVLYSIDFLIADIYDLCILCYRAFGRPHKKCHITWWNCYAILLRWNACLIALVKGHVRESFLNNQDTVTTVHL